MSRLGPVLVLLAGLACLPATAGAATVSTDAASGAIAYVAQTGEVNRLSVADRPEARLGFSDEVPVSAGPGCSAVTDRSAECPGGEVDATLADGDDQAVGFSTLFGLAFHGGAGNDVLVPSGASSLGDGGAGADRIFATSNSAAIGRGGDGDDVLRGGGPTATLEGDAGADLLVTTSQGTLSGGPGSDALVDRGRWQPDLHGGADSDVLIGRGSLAAGDGRDYLVGDGTLDGGGGNDWIAASGGTVSCGPGRDIVYAEGGASVAADCERVLAGPVPTPRRVAAAQDAADRVLDPGYWPL